MKRNVIVGETIEFKGYQSSSASYAVANETYANEKDSIIFEIRTSEGVNISSISSYSEEQEILLPRNSRYVVAGKKEIVRQTGKNVTVVQLVAVTDGGKVSVDRNVNRTHEPKLVQKKFGKWFSSIFK